MTYWKFCRELKNNGLRVLGIGYDNGKIDDNESDFDRWQTRIDASYLFRVAKDFYARPTVT